MGKKSVKDNKNIYFQSRENAGLTREQASELIGFMSESKIERIESEKIAIQPEDVVAMAEAYKNPSLCNHYCSNECRIGQIYVPHIDMTSLAEISLGLIASINALSQQKDRIIEIAEDGKLTEDELPDFLAILDRLDKMSLKIDSLKLWMQHAIADGSFDKELIDQIKEKISI